MTRKEKIIEILETWDDYILGGDINEDIADAIMALPIDVPGEEEMQEWVNKDKKSLIDYEVYTMSELKERLIGRFEGATWMRNETLKRNGKVL